MKGRKAKRQLHLFRNPAYLGGNCVVCRTRKRNHAHPEKPHMCDKCRETRVKSLYDNLPEAVREYDRKLEDIYDRSGVQNLNTPVMFPGESRERIPTPEDYSPGVDDKVKALMDKLKKVV